MLCWRRAGVAEAAARLAVGVADRETGADARRGAAGDEGTAGSRGAVGRREAGARDKLLVGAVAEVLVAVGVGRDGLGRGVDKSREHWRGLEAGTRRTERGKLRTQSSGEGDLNHDDD